MVISARQTKLYITVQKLREVNMQYGWIGDGLASRQLRLRFPDTMLPSNNLRQVVHTYLPLQVTTV